MFKSSASSAELPKKACAKESGHWATSSSSGCTVLRATSICNQLEAAL